MKVVLIDGYFGESHKRWAEELKAYSSHHIQLWGAKPKYWKWRMQGAAIHFAKELEAYDQSIDLFICTDMINVSLFKSLLPKKYSKVPIALYMHENQLTYPIDQRQKQNEMDYNYGFINYSSALVANLVMFNSQYHLDQFLEAIKKLLKIMPDMRHLETIDQIRQKSVVLPIGIISKVFKKSKKKTYIKPPLILWNHRWEFDKNPTAFFNCLFKLKKDNIPFRLAIAGESYVRQPTIFEEAKQRLSNEIIHFGYLKTKDTYNQLLINSDLLPVTSIHDFFGISVVEAIAAGAFPILPKRLSYPEHIDPQLYPECFYDHEEELYDKLKVRIIKKQYLSTERYQELVNKYDWENLINKYDDTFEGMAL